MAGLLKRQLMFFVDSEGQDAKSARTLQLMGGSAEQLCPNFPSKGEVLWKGELWTAKGQRGGRLKCWVCWGTESVRSMLVVEVCLRLKCACS